MGPTSVPRSRPRPRYPLAPVRFRPDLVLGLTEREIRRGDRLADPGARMRRGGWAGAKLVLHKLRFHPDFVTPFSPPCKGGGVRGVVPARPVTRSSHALSLSVLSHPSREARRIVLDFQGPASPPPDPPFARGGKGSLARDVIPSRATKTRVSKPSLQLGQHQLFTGTAGAGWGQCSAVSRIVGHCGVSNC